MRHLAYSVRHSLVPVNSSQAEIAQTDSLRAGRSGDRIPVEARFSSAIQTGFGALPASYTMGTKSFPGVKRRGVALITYFHLGPRLEKEWSYTSTPSMGLRGLF